jgi:hypothetical protein
LSQITWLADSRVAATADGWGEPPATAPPAAPAVVPPPAVATAPFAAEDAGTDPHAVAAPSSAIRASKRLPVSS